MLMGLAAFGPVFRVDLHQLVQWKPFAVNAEWPALVASNKLLGKNALWVCGPPC